MPNKDDSRFDYNIEFQPSYAWNDLNNKSAVQKSKLWNFLRSVKRRIYAETEKRLGFDLQRYFNHKGKEKNASVLKTDGFERFLDTHYNDQKMKKIYRVPL